MLEVGCGRGAFASLLKAQQPSVRYQGLAFNQAAVQAACEAGHDVVCRTLSDEAAQRPGQHDLVCRFQVLEHVLDLLAFLRDSVAARRRGGLVLVTVPAEDSFIGQQGDAWLNRPPHHSWAAVRPLQPRPAASTANGRVRPACALERRLTPTDRG